MAYGFQTRGCPRGCDFCIVGEKEGRKAYTVAPLEEFWNGQKFIKLLDPNPLAVTDWKDNLQQLIDSKAQVDFTQGVDIRLKEMHKIQMMYAICEDGMKEPIVIDEIKDLILEEAVPILEEHNFVKVVRCKDCKHYSADGWGYGNCYRKSVEYLRMADNGFCSFGEREEDGR